MVFEAWDEFNSEVLVESHVFIKYGSKNFDTRGVLDNFVFYNNFKIVSGVTTRIFDLSPLSTSLL